MEEIVVEEGGRGVYLLYKRNGGLFIWEPYYTFTRLTHSSYMLPIFDRKTNFDKRSKLYPVSEIFTLPWLSNKTWACPPHLNQGSEGACVGFAWAHELAATPWKITVDDSTAKTIYYAAQQWDEWAGTGYSGTSVLAGAKVVRSIGHMPEYRWAFGIDDVLSTLSHIGPLVLGIDWHNDMLHPDENGFITPTGGIAGGHAILASGVQIRKQFGFWWNNLPEPIIRLHNSWGVGFGKEGDCFITASNLEKLLQAGGEACVPIKRN